jgi:hypothetical protein
MKAWDNQTPLNKHIKLLKVTREHLWKELIDNPFYSEPKVKKISRYIEQLNKKIVKRSLTDEEVQKLVSDVKVYSRNYKRIAAKKRKPRRPKMTPGAIKFVLKHTNNEKKNNNKKAQAHAAQIDIFGQASDPTVGKKRNLSKLNQPARRHVIRASAEKVHSKKQP